MDLKSTHKLMYNKILSEVLWRKEQELVEHISNTETSCSFDQQKRMGPTDDTQIAIKIIKLLLSPTNYNSLQYKDLFFQLFLIPLLFE